MDGRPLRILQVFRAPLGGLFRHVIDLTRGQIALGHQVGILCASNSGNARDAEVLRRLEPDLALGLRRIPMARQIGWSDAAAVRTMMRLRADTKPDIIHGHGSKGGAYSRLPALFDRSWPTTCYTPHGGSFHYVPGTRVYRVYSSAERLLARHTDLFLNESEYIAAKVRAMLGARAQLVRVVHNGVADSEFAPIQKNATVADLLYIGELRFLKGIDILLEAVAQLRTGGLAPTLRIQGSGPDASAIRERTSELGLDDLVTFAPPGPIREALAASRIMVVPSRNESLPYVVLEAAAARQPLVATRVGGIPEIFGPFAGRLVEPESADHMAMALRTALTASPQELVAQADELSERIAKLFSLETMVSGIMAAYRDALSGR
ncbi:glycosyltransferase family 4 protein [Terrihabitans sp. B22-R8]|uniref:glycosyltransferase family 4 protein n=1 Tax=Terrihabitans sp. B22-R8 TaxID=3425128 RepID=UPI00403C7574